MRDGKWEYTIKAYAGSKHRSIALGKLALETTHEDKSSRDIEISAFRKRMRRGEIAYIEVISHVEPYGSERIYWNP